MITWWIKFIAAVLAVRLSAGPGIWCRGCFEGCGGVGQRRWSVSSVRLRPFREVRVCVL